MKTLTYIGILLISWTSLTFAQSPPQTSVMTIKVVDKDTIYLYSIPEIYIFAKRTFKTEKEYMQYTKLVRDVKRVYPYSKMAGRMYNDYANMLINVKSESQKQKLMKKVEDDLKLQFEGQIRQLTITQGRILIKLVDRETSKTSYNIIKEFRGTFSAFLWQSVARIFGSSLKLEYNKNTEDRMIEDIVIGIEKGLI